MEWGRHLAAHLKAGDIICLSGDLGSGKTTLVKGLAKGLRIKESEVNSPTFVLMNCYQGNLPLFHFDLYRLDESIEMFNLGYEEFMYGEGIAVVEWAEKLGILFPQDCLMVRMQMQKENERLLEVSAQGDRSLKILDRL